MATWHVGMTWTPALAIRLANILTEHGAGHLRAVNQLRAAAANKSAILGQRAEAAYEAAHEELKSEEGWPTCRDAVSVILREAMGAPE